MRTLERRYRRLLALFPIDDRSARGEELVSTLLDIAPASRRWPSGPDVFDLSSSAMRARRARARQRASARTWSRWAGIRFVAFGFALFYGNAIVWSVLLSPAGNWLGQLGLVALYGGTAASCGFAAFGLYALSGRFRSIKPGTPMGAQPSALTRTRAVPDRAALTLRRLSILLIIPGCVGYVIVGVLIAVRLA